MKMKRCSHCRQIKKVSEFYPKSANRDGYHSYCKVCHNEYTKEYYQKNKDRRCELMRKSRARRNEEHTYLLIEKKDKKPCSDCGKRYPWYVMDFDHVRGKKLFVMSTAGTRSKESVLKEIAKCDLVCSNCHRARTYRRRHHGKDLTLG